MYSHFAASRQALAAAARLAASSHQALAVRYAQVHKPQIKSTLIGLRRPLEPDYGGGNPRYAGSIQSIQEGPRFQ